MRAWRLTTTSALTRSTDLLIRISHARRHDLSGRKFPSCGFGYSLSSPENWRVAEKQRAISERPGSWGAVRLAYLLTLQWLGQRMVGGMDAGPLHEGQSTSTETTHSSDKQAGDQSFGRVVLLACNILWVGGSYFGGCERRSLAGSRSGRGRGWLEGGWQAETLPVAASADCQNPGRGVRVRVWGFPFREIVSSTGFWGSTREAAW